MRPVSKGADRGVFNPYNDAQKPLIEQLGEYCSYCERLVPCGIHVEHKLPKGEYPEFEFNWSNFLLGCVNCNSAKGSEKINLADYIWPDSDNTLRAFSYGCEGRVFPIDGFNNVLDSKIKNTWILLGLNRHPDPTIEGFSKPTEKDRRWLHRKQEWEAAYENKAKLLNNDTSDLRDILVERATAKGMFSIWFAVFFDDVDMKERLVRAFKNTDVSSFGVDYSLVKRPAGQV